MNEREYRPELTFESEHRLPDQIEGEKALAKLEIFPAGGNPWNFTLLSAFLNELDEFVKYCRRGFIATNESGRPDGRFSFTHQSIPNFYLYVKITDRISVQASMKWLIRKWDRKEIVEFSHYRKEGKMRKIPVMQTLHFFSLTFNTPSDGTKCLIDHSPLIYCSPYDFTNIFHFFTKHIFDIGIPNILDTCSIYEYSDIFIRRSKESVNSLASLNKKIHGYLSIDIQKSTKKRKLETIKYNGVDHYIIGGVYISPFAQSILLSDDIIKGLLLDTTWKVMPMYVTSIIMASTMNIGIPIGFAFGSGEDKSLYERHFKAFSEQCGIDLSKFVIESDQGSALKAVCDDNFAEHLACLRHLLVSLRYSPYSYAVGELLKCTSLLDHNNALTEFSNRFAKITDANDLKELNNVLEKIGMNFADGSINLVNQKRWDQVSMLSRINFRMPSTTNSLESSHGHLNKKTPRHNGFWASINRLCESFILKTNLLNIRIQHNYSYLKSTTQRRLNSMDIETLNLQQMFYSTTVDHCNCGENKLMAAILRIDVPCSHRLAKGASFPECPKLNITPVEQWKTLVVAYNELPESQDTIAYDENKGNKTYAINIIRRYSGYTKKDEIEQFVNASFNSDGDECFINGKAVSMIQLIYKGISEFTQKKNMLKKAKIHPK